MYNFGQAIEAAKQGKKVAREGWNGKKMFVYQMPGYDNIPANEATSKRLGVEVGTQIKVRPYLAMFDAQGYVVPGWLASQTDILAEDWVILN